MTFRAALLLFSVGVVAADDVSLDSLIMDFAGGDGTERRLGCEEFHQKMQEARVCHGACMKDAACHQKCPKPWTPMIEDCREMPDIKNCHDNCANDAACTASCPKFSVDWLQKTLEADPNLAFMKAQMFCPRIEEVHACHESCIPEDFACHHQCPKMFEGHKHHWQQRLHGSAQHRWHPAQHYQANETFDIKGFEALMMASSFLPPNRFNGRFVPTGEMINGRPAFIQDPQPHLPKSGQARVIAWFNGHWRYFSYYDDMSKEGMTKCTFMVKSDAKHPVDIPATQQWFVHPSALKHIQAPGFDTSRPNFPVEIRRVPDDKGCYDKGEYGLWCPKDNGWYCVHNCKDEATKEGVLDERGCYDKGEYGVWCPKGVDWVCVDNCKGVTINKASLAEAKVMSSAEFEKWLTGLYDRVMTYVSSFGQMRLKEFGAHLEIHV